MKPLHALAKLLHGIELVREDVRSICANDPAARSPLEVMLVYPGLHAVWLHRAAHMLWENDVKLPARLLSYMNRFVTGIEIHPGARLGRRVVIDHGMGIVIGETASVGEGCILYKGVVLGGTSLERKVRHPQIGKNVVIGSNACILGAIHIGDHTRIGSGSVVVREVPPKPPSSECRRGSSFRSMPASMPRSTTLRCPTPSST